MGEIQKIGELGMRNFEDELRTLVRDRWSLTGDLARKKLLFTTSILSPEEIVKKTLEFHGIGGSQRLLSAQVGSAEGDAGVGVFIRVKAKSQSQKAIEEAKKFKANMRIELDRIVRKEELPTGWEFALVERWVNRDSRVFTPPLIQDEVTVRIKYQSN